MSGISTSAIGNQASAALQNLKAETAKAPNPNKLDEKEKFQEFVAGTFYKQMLKSMRSSQHKPAYFHGGRAEEVFQGQLDQVITDNMARTHGKAIAEPFFEAYLQRR